MTDLDPAVEAIVNVLHNRDCGDRCEPHTYAATHLPTAEAILTAAAPIIAEQALCRAEQAINFETTCLRCGDLLGQMLDMRTRIEALRDEWRADERTNGGTIDDLYMCAAALDALIGGA